ncbi:peptidase M50 [Streptomyces rubiginosohelvolus]|uniref:peptidase M50 n=1 Tax=Streptomyces rubiginosohelvolus TaxID=67362 RepID=UPI00371359C6
MNGDTDALSAHRPCLRPDILISAPWLRGADTVHLVQDPVDGACFTVGLKEHFLISRLDGVRSTQEIADEYASAFGRRLSDAHWRRLLGLLVSRRLLTGSGALTVTAPTPTPPLTGTLYRGSLRLVADAEAASRQLHQAVRPLLRRWFVLPLIALCVGMEIVLAAEVPTLVSDTGWLLHQPAAVAAVFTLLWLSTVGHELAHGVSARHYGGSVSEIGLRWRLPVAIMYCRVDNYRFLARRRHQLVIGASGAFANLIFLLPFAIWWLVLGTDDPTRRFLSALLLLGSLQALVNFLPLPPMDGYTMLGNALRVDDYAPASGRYLRLRLRDRQSAATYSKQARLLYTAYGIGSFLLVIALAGALIAGAWHQFIR